MDPIITSAEWRILSVKKENEVNDTELNSGQTNKPTSCVKLLSVYIDDQLSLDKYVTELCIRAVHQNNALRRIVKYLSPECKIVIYIWILLLSILIIVI